MEKLHNKNLGNVVVVLYIIILYYLYYYYVQFLEILTELSFKTKYAFNITNNDFKSSHFRIVSVGLHFSEKIV